MRFLAKNNKEKGHAIFCLLIPRVGKKRRKRLVELLSPLRDSRVKEDDAYLLLMEESCRLKKGGLSKEEEGRLYRCLPLEEEGR